MSEKEEIDGKKAQNGHAATAGRHHRLFGKS